MFYIHHTVCISPQQTFHENNLEELRPAIDNKLYALPASPSGIPNAVLRRMGKAVKMAVSATEPLIKLYDSLDGIIIGTANGGMEDCIRFLNQIIQYEEGVLTPTNFVQSTPNAIAAQIGFMSKNKGYNITHVHRGLAFENAMLDIAMLLKENPNHSYLLGGIDEISDYNFNIEYLCGYIKKEIIDNKVLYKSTTNGSIAGEAAVMFIANATAEGALAKVKALYTFNSDSPEEIKNQITDFVNKHKLNQNTVNLILSGENGDARYNGLYNELEQLLIETPSMRYKHLSGEFQTASAFALWLATQILNSNKLPVHLIKKEKSIAIPKTILLYNNYQGYQHSLMLVERNT